MRRFLINSNNVNYNKRKRRYVTAGLDGEWTPEGAIENRFGMDAGSVQAQGNQPNYSTQQPQGNGLNSLPIIGKFAAIGQAGEQFGTQIENTGINQNTGYIDNTTNYSIGKGIKTGFNPGKEFGTRMFSGDYKGAMISSIPIAGGIINGFRDSKKINKNIDAETAKQTAYNNAQQQLEQYRIDNPYRENQATFAMGGENNMSQSNELNSFNGGDGSQDSIERPNSFVNNKETEHKNVIHSNSFVITPEMAEHYSLPNNIIGKTPSEASLILSKDTIRTKPQHNEQKLLHTSNIKDQFAIAADKANKRNEVGIYALDKLSTEIGELLNPQQPEQQGQPQQSDMQQQNVPDDMTLNGGMAYGGIHIKKSHRGLLHKNLGVKQGEKIPASKLIVKSTDSPAVKKRKIFAQNAKKWSH